MHFMPGYADYVPIPNNFQNCQNAIIKYSKKIIELTKELKSKQHTKYRSLFIIKQIEENNDKINDLVYKAYDLNSHDIQIIEELTPK